MAFFASDERLPVVVAGCRTPFLRSGTDFKDLMSYDLARIALKVLLDLTAIPHEEIHRVIFGNVLSEPKTSNVAREAVLGAGLPQRIPAHTVSMACISGCQAITQASELIQNGHAEVVIAGGTECLSNIPILLKRPLRQKLLEAKKLRNPLDYLRWLKGLRPSHLLPEMPRAGEFSTDLTMGESSDRMAAHWGVSRKEQDRFAMRSHQFAAMATQQGLFSKEIIKTPIPPRFRSLDSDNGIRGDTSMESLTKLPPAFYRPHGTATAGNSSFLSDGAAAVLIMSRVKAQALGYTPIARIVAHAYVGCDPLDELLLGPTYAIPVVLEKVNLTLKEMDVLEFHEAFAGQILANVKAIESNTFGREKLGLSGRVGEVYMDRLNALGGSLSLGHPFGATGIRLLINCCNRLQREDGRFGLIASCAAGGLGHAMIVERLK
jgi:acetyl-CoA acetyltransferase family protein